MSGAAKTCIGCGVFFLILGILFILVGTLGVSDLPKQKLDYLIIDSEHSEQYDNWAGGYDKQNEYDMTFYFYNLTNPEEVRSTAAIPNYTLAGPYVYRRYRKAQNVSFPDNGNLITYSDFRDYQFNAKASSGSKFDYIQNINPVFISALAQAGSEASMLGGAVGGYIQNFTGYFTGEFISLYTSWVLPEYLQDAMAAQIAVINQTTHDTSMSYDFFLNAWCNGTELDIGNWTGWLLTAGSGKPTLITQESAKMLLDPSISLSLLNTENMTSWTWDRALTNATYMNVLLQTFNITRAQFEAIWYWRMTTFGPYFIYPKVMQKYNLTEISELGWVQWTFGLDILGGTLDNPVSIYGTFPVEEIGYYCTIELFFILSVPPPFPDWQTSSQVFNNVTGLGNITVFQTFALAMSNQSPSTNFSIWGMTSDQAEQFYTYVFVEGVEQVVPALIDAFGPSGGLILNQTVDDWIFNCNYFLINLLLPVPQPCSLLLNHTFFANATIKSGKNNLSEINEYVVWNGMTSIDGVWAEDVPIEGCTELGQFPPDQNEQTKLQTFNDEFARTMPLNYNTSSSVRDIPTNQFVLDYNAIFSVNPLYFQTIPGFANMTNFKQAPIYYSLWDMFHVDESIRQRVIGMPNSSYEGDCSTTVDVEPITGNTLRVAKRLQANIFTPPNCTFCTASPSYFDNDAFPENTFFPFVKAGEFSEISESLAVSVRIKIAALRYGPRYGLIVGLAVGIFLLIVGVGMIIFGRNRMKRDYAVIPDYVMTRGRY